MRLGLHPGLCPYDAATLSQSAGQDTAPTTQPLDLDACLSSWHLQGLDSSPPWHAGLPLVLTVKSCRRLRCFCKLCNYHYYIFRIFWFFSQTFIEEKSTLVVPDYEVYNNYSYNYYLFVTRWIKSLQLNACGVYENKTYTILLKCSIA